MKDKTGRRRYILLKNNPDLKTLMKEIKNIDRWAKMIYFDNDFAILRCKHWHKDAIIKILHDHEIHTYITSGTIKKTKKIMDKIKS